MSRRLAECCKGLDEGKWRKMELTEQILHVSKQYWTLTKHSMKPVVAECQKINDVIIKEIVLFVTTRVEQYIAADGRAFINELRNSDTYFQ